MSEWLSLSFLVNCCYASLLLECEDNHQNNQVQGLVIAASDELTRPISAATLSAPSSFCLSVCIWLEVDEIWKEIWKRNYVNIGICSCQSCSLISNNTPSFIIQISGPSPGLDILVDILQYVLSSRHTGFTLDFIDHYRFSQHPLPLPTFCVFVFLVLVMLTLTYVVVFSAIKLSSSCWNSWLLA